MADVDGRPAAATARKQGRFLPFSPPTDVDAEIVASIEPAKGQADLGLDSLRLITLKEISCLRRFV
jgi:hypothetical protein